MDGKPGDRGSIGQTASVCPLCDWRYLWPSLDGAGLTVGHQPGASMNEIVGAHVQAAMIRQAEAVETAISGHFADDHGLYGVEEIEAAIEAAYRRARAERGAAAGTREEWMAERVRDRFAIPAPPG